MSDYKYYLAESGLGAPHEVYRGKPTYDTFSSSGLQRAKKDGTWTTNPEDARWLLDLWSKGEFDPSDDEITEAKALEFLNTWRTSGKWPGRE